MKKIFTGSIEKFQIFPEEGLLIFVMPLTGELTIGDKVCLRDVTSRIIQKGMLTFLEKKDSFLKIRIRGILDSEIPEKGWITLNTNPLDIFVEGGTGRIGGCHNQGSSYPIYTAIFHDFFIHSTPVSQKGFSYFLSHNNQKLIREENKDNFPETEMTFHQALLFCNYLSEAEGFLPCYTVEKGKLPIFNDTCGYRLPTEAEWEYAAKGGQKSEGFEYAGSNNYQDVAWTEEEYRLGPQESAKLQPNELGIFDMCGNVYEWCWDIYHQNYYYIAPQENGYGPWPEDFYPSSQRVCRGGDWTTKFRDSKVNTRSFSFSDGSHGLRPVRSLKAREVSSKPEFSNFPEMILVKSGEYMMGSNLSKEIDSQKYHLVKLNSFFLSEIPVSNDIWGIYQAWKWQLPKPVYEERNKFIPATDINWFEACEFCNFLSVYFGFTPCYTINLFPENFNQQKKPSPSESHVIWDKNQNGFRLPTEAEWEYAAKNGHSGPKHDSASKGFFNQMLKRYVDPYYIYSGSNNPEAVGIIKEPFRDGPGIMKQKKPNKLKIYDLSGNIYEWCWDFYDEKTYESSPLFHPSGPPKGEMRVKRGGSWKQQPRDCCVFSRWKGYPKIRDFETGLRLARNYQ